MKKLIIDSEKQYPLVYNEEKDMFYNKALYEDFKKNYPFNFPDEDNKSSVKTFKKS